MCLTASMASRFSVRLTGRPASRSSWMKPDSRSSIGDGSVLGSTAVMAGVRSLGSGGELLEAGLLLAELLDRLGDVGLVLEQDVGGLGGGLVVDRLHAEQHQRAGPVERLRHRRALLELELAEGADDAGDLVGERVGDVRH